jgi:transmembrane sensor
MTRAHDSLSRNADTIEQEAAEWLVRVEQDGAPETSRALAAWLGSNPRHRAAFLRISTAWRRADALRHLADPDEEADPDLLAPERPPANESITEPAAVEYPPMRAPRPSVSQPSRVFRFGIAATLAVVLVGALAFFNQTFHSGQTYATGIGEFRRVTLPDGSSLALNTSTQVRVAYTNSRRKVELVQGEALFEVTHDATKPFVVTAGDTVVRDIGTAFVVRLRSPKSVDVLVSEGQVAIDPPSQVLVSANEIAFVRGETITRRAVDDITRRLSWTEGRQMLIFNNETLADAVAEMNRYNHRQIVISDPSIAGKRIGGAYKATNPDGFATALEKTFGLEARVYEGTFDHEIRLSKGAP